MPARKRRAARKTIWTNSTQKITPFLWFDTRAEEAAKFYCSIFKDSKILGLSRYGEGGPMPKGTVMGISFRLDGTEFKALNAGPHYKFTPAVSFFVNCKNQREVDTYWEKLLSGGGKPVQCGWLEDKFGLSWQIVPVQLGQLLGDKNKKKAANVMAAMMQMVKLDVRKLQEAYDRE